MSVPAAAADDNLARHFTWVQDRCEGMRADRSPELTLAHCGLPCDTFNAVCRARLPEEGLDGRVRSALAFFGELPFSWWHGPSDEPADLPRALAAAGLEAAESELAMACPLERVEGLPELGGSFEIRRVATADELLVFAELLASLWDPPDADVIRFYRRGTPVLLTPASPIRLYLGYAEGEAVATAEATLSGGAVGLYSISTLPSHRGRGYGSAMTTQPLLEARAEGYRHGILQAAPGAVGIYRRIGFEDLGEITEFKPPQVQ